MGSMKTRTEDGVTIQEIVLEFGPEGRGRLNVELMIPPGEGASRCSLRRTITGAGP